MTMMKRQLSPLGIPTLILCLCYTACLVRGSAETKKSILKSFEGYVANKLRKTKPADGIVCSSPGKSPKSAACFDKVGKQNCLERKKYFDNMSPEIRNQIRYSRGGHMPLEYVHDKRCPYPCGCWLASPPEVDGKAMTKVWKGKGATWSKLNLF